MSENDKAEKIPKVEVSIPGSESFAHGFWFAAGASIAVIAISTIIFLINTYILANFLKSFSKAAQSTFSSQITKNSPR